jgi:hypothetical protein
MKVNMLYVYLDFVTVSSIQKKTDNGLNTNINYVYTVNNLFLNIL